MGKEKTFLDLVREYFPDATEEEADFILWEKTAYPMCGVDHVKKQLGQYKEAKSQNKDICERCGALVEIGQRECGECKLKIGLSGCGEG